MLLEIPLQHRLVDGGERLDIGDRHVLVGLVHGPADEAEIKHRAVIPDEPRIGGAAGRAQFRPPPGDPLDRIAHEVAERSRRRVEGFTADRDVQLISGPAGGGIEPAAQQRRQAGRVVAVVEPDVEEGAGRAGDDVGRIAAGPDPGDLQRRRLEMCGALVERLGDQGIEQRDQPVRRVVGELRIGGMALRAGDRQHRVEAAAAADLDHLAERLGVGRLAGDAGVQLVPVLREPAQHLDGAVDRRPFLVAGDQEADRAVERAGREPPLGGRDEAGDRALHVGGAAAPDHAVAQRAGERAGAPGLLGASRHHVGMAGKAQVRCGIADPRIEVVDVGCARVREFQAVAGEPQPLEDEFQQVERAALRRRHAGAADQIPGQLDRVDHGPRATSYFETRLRRSSA
jgi:hypothetical protein